MTITFYWNACISVLVLKLSCETSLFLAFSFVRANWWNSLWGNWFVWTNAQFVEQKMKKRRRLFSCNSSPLATTPGNSIENSYVKKVSRSPRLLDPNKSSLVFLWSTFSDCLIRRIGWSSSTNQLSFAHFRSSCWWIFFMIGNIR